MEDNTKEIFPKDICMVKESLEKTKVITRADSTKIKRYQAK